MGKEKALKAPAPSGWSQALQELFKYDLYKRSQGRMVRQITGLAICVAFALGAWRMYSILPAQQAGPVLKYVVPAILLVAGFWIGYRIVNLPTFADFLIAVEAEMNKVSWPSRAELIRASLVVIIMIFGLTMLLFTYDTIWNFLLSKVLKVTIV
jgi:preprotein translocase subunit SecE